MTVKKKAPVHVGSRSRFRMLPVTLTMLALVLVVKLNAIYFDLKHIREAHAAEEAKPEETATPAPAEKGHEEAVKVEGGHGEEAKKADPLDALKDEEAKGEVKKEEGAKEEEPKEEAKKEGGHGEEAKEEGEHGEEAKKEEDDGHGSGHGEAKAPEEAKTAGAGKSTIKEIEELKAKQNAAPYTKDELDLLQNLTKRRQELEQREQEMELKEKVLEATEKRIGDKLTEMKTLQADLGKVVEEYNNQQNSQIGSLVKIYENMKPADAAKIFNELDMPILLEVIAKMSERKVAPVLAGMNPKKARDLTQELAELRRSQAAKKAAAQQASAQ